VQEFTTWDGEPVSRERPHGATVVVASRGPQGWRYLLLHRAHHAGPAREGDWAWTPPTGSLRPGEDVSACVARELREEGPRGVLEFTSTVTWEADFLHVVEDYALRTPGLPAGHRRNDFVMRPWNSQEISERLTAAGFGRVEVGPGVGRTTSDRLFVFAQL
jgi:hypothetical protein